MAKFIGRQQEVGIGREATRGTLVAPAHWVPKVNFSVEDKVMKALFQGSYGKLSGGDSALVAQKWAEGNLDMEAQDRILGLITYALFGTQAAASFNGAYKHTFSEQNSVQATTLALFMDDPIGAANSKTLAYAMAMVDSFELDVQLGELVRCNVGFVAKSHTDYAEQTPSYTASNKFTHKHLTFKVAANEAGLDAASGINLQSLNLKISKAVTRENALGTVQPVDILARTMKITGTIKLTYEDRTYRDYMMDGTTKAIRIDLLNSDVTIGTTNPAFRIDLPKVHFDQWEPSHDLEEIAMQEITFEALYDVTNSKLIGTSYVVNEVASY